MKAESKGGRSVSRAGVGTDTGGRSPAVGAAPVAAPARAWPVLVATGLAMFLVQLDYFALALALPAIADDLDSTPADLQWTVSGYMIGLGAVLVLAGRVGDLFGRRRALIAGVALFGAASVGCGLAQSAGVLVAVRVAQGVGAALILALTVSIVTNAFAPGVAARRVGQLFGVAALGTALGPFAGGALTELVGWRWLFWINVPCVLIAIRLLLSSVAESRDESAPPRLDVAGAVLLTTAVALTAMGADRAAEWGLTSGRTLAAIGTGVALLPCFVVLQRRVRWPLLDLGLVRNVPFCVATLGGMLSNMAFVVVLFLSTIHLQVERGLTPLEASFVFLAPALATVVSGPVAGRLGALDRPALVLGAEMLVQGAAVLAMVTADGWAVYVAALAVAGFASGLGWAFAAVATQRVVAPARAGEAAGVTLTILIVAGAIAIAAAAAGLEAIEATGDEGATQPLLKGVAIALMVAGPAVAALQRALSAQLASGRARRESAGR